MRATENVLGDNVSSNISENEPTLPSDWEPPRNNEWIRYAYASS